MQAGMRIVRRFYTKAGIMNEYAQLAAEMAWTVDTDACRVIHETGLVIQFTSAPDGLIDGFPVNRDTWLALFDESERDFARKAFCALMNEGAQVYCRSLARRS